MRDRPAVYRPRHPERSVLYQLFERHGERYKRSAEERFGRLRPVAVRAVDAFLECGRLQNGFARMRCPGCRAEHLLAFSCRVRNLCPSCQMKRALLLAFRLVDELLLPAPHAHVVFTIPKALRALFERDRRLLGVLARAAWRALADVLEADAPPEARAAMVASIQTFGETANWNPHIHAVALCGVVLPGGQVLEKQIDARRVHDRFRERLLRALVDADSLSPGFAEKVASWTWPKTGFSVYVGEELPPGAPDVHAALKRVSCYLARPTVAYRRVEKTRDGRYRILASSPGRRPEEQGPLETIHRLLLHVPERGQHQVRYYGAYANRLRRRYREAEPDAAREDETDAAVVSKAERGVDRDGLEMVARLVRWARLIARVFEVDPLLCPRCGHEMRVVGFVTKPAVIDKILAHREAKQLTSPFEPRAPPAA